MLTSLSGCAVAQLPDYISVKKANGRTVLNYYRDMDIEFATRDGQRFQGTIADIFNDSLFLKVYQVRRVLSIWNIPVLDTVNSFILPFHYQEIKRIFVPKINARQVLASRVGSLLLVGGVGYMALNLVNSALRGEPVTDEHNVKNLSIALAAAGGGYFIKRQNAPLRSGAGRRSKIVYIKMN